MGIKLKFIPYGDFEKDKNIFVHGEVHNAREYMEQFKANNKKSLGIDFRNNSIFAPKKSIVQIAYTLIEKLVVALLVVAMIRGFFSTPKNEIPTMSIFALFGLLLFCIISNQLKRYFRYKSCTTQVNAIIIGKYLRRRASSGSSHIRTSIINTVFLVEYNAKVYLLCERNDGTEYGDVGDIVPIFINSENPFAFYTRQFKKSSFQEFCAVFVIICVAAIYIFWICRK